MKKVSLLLVVLLIGYTTAQSQNENFGKGSSALNLGVGFGNTIYSGYNMGYPSISLSYEYGITEIDIGSNTGVISAGALVGFGGYKYNYYWGSYKGNYILTAARANFHFIFMDKFDPYAGLSLGYYFGNNTIDNAPVSWNAANTNGFYVGGYAGARWFFTPMFAAFAEIGWGISVFTIGGTLKF